MQIVSSGVIQPRRLDKIEDHSSTLGDVVEWYQNLSADNKNALKNILGLIGSGFKKAGDAVSPKDPDADKGPNWNTEEGYEFDDIVGQTPGRNDEITGADFLPDLEEAEEAEDKSMYEAIMRMAEKNK